MLADRTTLLSRLTAKSFLAFGMRNAMTAKPGDPAISGHYAQQRGH